MKKFLYLLPTIFLSLCMACTEAEIVSPKPEPGDGGTEEGVPLSIKNLGLSLEIESRSIVTGDPGEEDRNPNPLTSVGVCVTKQNSSGTISLYESGIQSQVFTYNAMAIPPAWELGEGEEMLCLYAEKGTVYAYAPSSGKSISLSGTPKVPLMSGVKILDKQTFRFNDGGKQVDAATDVQWETDQDDYLYCMAEEQVDRWHPEVSLLMQHALSKVSFRVLEEGEAFADCLIEKVVLKSSGGFKRSATSSLNLATGELSGMLTVVDQLVFTAGGDMRGIGSVPVTGETNKTPVQAFGLVIPVTDVSVTLELTLDDDRVFKMKPTESSGTDPGTFTVKWEKGYNYIYNIRLQAQGIELTKIQVAGWNDGGEYDIPVE